MIKSNLKNSLNVAFILFENLKDAEKCSLDMNDRVLAPGELPLIIKLYRIFDFRSPSKEEMEIMNSSKQETLKNKYDRCNLIVKSLPKDLDDKEFYEYFVQGAHGFLTDKVNKDWALVNSQSVI